MRKFVDAHLHAGKSVAIDDPGAKQAKKVQKDMVGCCKLQAV
jgi:hypothetical protein